MPVDAGDLKKVVDSICSLKESGGSESDIEGMIAATLPLAEKVETWGSQALVSLLYESFLLWLAGAALEQTLMGEFHLDAGFIVS